MRGGQAQANLWRCSGTQLGHAIPGGEEQAWHRQISVNPSHTTGWMNGRGRAWEQSRRYLPSPEAVLEDGEVEGEPQPRGVGRPERFAPQWVCRATDTRRTYRYISVTTPQDNDDFVTRTCGAHVNLSHNAPRQRRTAAPAPSPPRPRACSDPAPPAATMGSQHQTCTPIPLYFFKRKNKQKPYHLQLRRLKRLPLLCRRGPGSVHTVDAHEQTGHSGMSVEIRHTNASKQRPAYHL